jgi:hypothetical protein
VTRVHTPRQVDGKYETLVSDVRKVLDEIQASTRALKSFSYPPPPCMFQWCFSIQHKQMGIRMTSPPVANLG